MKTFLNFLLLLSFAFQSYGRQGPYSSSVSNAPQTGKASVEVKASCRPFGNRVCRDTVSTIKKQELMQNQKPKQKIKKK